MNDFNADQKELKLRMTIGDTSRLGTCLLAPGAKGGGSVLVPRGSSVLA